MIHIADGKKKEGADRWMYRAARQLILSALFESIPSRSLLDRAAMMIVVHLLIRLSRSWSGSTLGQRRCWNTRAAFGTRWADEEGGGGGGEGW